MSYMETVSETPSLQLIFLLVVSSLSNLLNDKTDRTLKVDLGNTTLLENKY